MLSANNWHFSAVIFSTMLIYIFLPFLSSVVNLLGSPLEFFFSYHTIKYTSSKICSDREGCLLSDVNKEILGYLS